MKRILVIEREFGCGGSVVAAKAAQRLGWKLFDRSLTDDIARLARVSPDLCRRREERVDPWLYRLAKVFWRGSYERSLPLPESAVFDADRLVCLAQQVIEQAAAAGDCVIVGRGAPYFLRDRDDTLSVFLYGPRQLKLQRVRNQVKTDAEAVSLLDAVDRERKEFVKHYFNLNWPTRTLYHLMLNMALGEDAVAAIILSVLGRPDRGKDAGSV